MPYDALTNIIRRDTCQIRLHSLKLAEETLQD